MNAASFSPTLPLDVRLMQISANALLALVVVLAAVMALLALLRHPMFAIRSIRLDDDGNRSAVAAVRATALPQLAGNFYAIDLAQGRRAFETVPWVRRAVVRRVWPDRLVVAIEEHRPVAIWSADQGDDQLVNVQGEVFEANLGDVEDDSLPVFAGPPGSAAQILSMHRRLQPLLQGAVANIARLGLSQGGSWHAELDNGARIEIGRGSDAEVLARVARFVRTLPAAAARLPQRALQYVDLRHRDGYALHLAGVATGASAVAAGRTKNN
jgi:cell division protein FtsQ